MISYRRFIGGCIFLYVVLILLIPGLVDVASVTFIDQQTIRIIMKVNYMFLNLFTSKLYTPAMNIIINYSLDKSMRSAMNSIFYLGVSFSLLFINYATEQLTNYYFDDLVEPESPLVKYKALSFFLFFQLLAFFIILATKIKVQEEKFK